MNNGTRGLRTKTICFGRFLIDIPEIATVTFRPALVAGWDISVDVAETSSEFDLRLQQTLAKIQRNCLPDGAQRAESITNVDSPAYSGKLLVFSRKVTSRFDGSETQTYLIYGHLRIEGASVALFASSPTPEPVNEMRNLMTQLSLLTDDRIPEEKGFCIGNGFVREPFVAEGGEDIALAIGLPGQPDVSISIYTSSANNRSISLLVRSRRREAFGSSEDVKVVRADYRILSGTEGDEIAELIKEPNGARGQSFVWESRGMADNVYAPFISIKMSTGHGHADAPVMSSLRDDAAIAMWDEIVSSFRMRPITHAAHAQKRIPCLL
jgi:hypothetical protein